MRKTGPQGPIMVGVHAPLAYGKMGSTSIAARNMKGGQLYAPMSFTKWVRSVFKWSNLNNICMWFFLLVTLAISITALALNAQAAAERGSGSN